MSNKHHRAFQPSRSDDSDENGGTESIPIAFYAKPGQAARITIDIRIGDAGDVMGGQTVAVSQAPAGPQATVIQVPLGAALTQARNLGGTGMSSEGETPDPSSDQDSATPEPSSDFEFPDVR